MEFKGTAGKNAPQGFGGFNVSEFNIQRHQVRPFNNDFSEQDHKHEKYSGYNPLNPPKAVDPSTQKLGKGANPNFGWRERTLALPVPGQVAGSFGKLPYTSADTSLLQWKLHHGFGANDPSLMHLIDERNIAPQVRADWQWQADSYLHSDIGVPSVVNQNMVETPSQNKFPRHLERVVRGKHDHTNLHHHIRPAINNDSNTATGTHHTSGIPPDPMTSGFRATQGPLERPLLLSDLPLPPQPMPV
jgi:hypothetical protein